MEEIEVVEVEEEEEGEFNGVIAVFCFLGIIIFIGAIVFAIF